MTEPADAEMLAAARVDIARVTHANDTLIGAVVSSFLDEPELKRERAIASIVNAMIDKGFNELEVLLMWAVLIVERAEQVAGRTPL